MSNKWICDCCGEAFDNEVDLLAHLFQSYCEEELKQRHKENDED